MSTIKFNELASRGTITLTDLLAIADANGLVYKSTTQELQTFLNTIGVSAYQGVLLAADAAVSADGIYLAGDSGTYTNNGGIVVDLSSTITFISVTGTQTTFTKVEIPVTLTALETEINTLTQNINYPFARTATLDLDGEVKFAVRDFCIKSGVLSGVDYNLRIARNLAGSWIIQLRSDSTVISEYTTTTRPTENTFQIYTLSAFGGSGIESYALVKFDELSENTDYVDTTKYKLNNYDNALLNETAFYQQAATWTSFTGASVDGFTAEAPSSGIQVALSDNINVTTGQIVNVSFNVNLVSGSNPIVTFRHNGGFEILTISSGVVNQDVTITGDDANAYVQVQYNDGSAGSIVVSGVQVTDANSYLLLGFDNSKFIKPLIDISNAEMGDDTRNNKNRLHYLSSVKNIGGYQSPTAELNWIPLYGQSLSTASESDIQLTTANVLGNQIVGSSDPYYTPSATGFSNLIAGVRGSEKEYCNIHAGNRLKKELDEKTFGLTDANKMLISVMGVGGNAIEQLSKTWSQGLVDGLNQYQYGFLGALNQAKTQADGNSKTLVCPAIMWMQGEANAIGIWGTNRDGTTPGGTPTQDKATYKTYLETLKNDMQLDIMSVTSQTEPPLFFMYIPSGRHTEHFDVPIQMAFLEFEQENDDVIISNPAYLGPNNGSHLSSNGYRMLGESFGKKMTQAFIEGKKYPPLNVREIEISGSQAIINLSTFYDVVLDQNTTKPQTDYGFQIKKNGSLVSITSIEVGATFLKINCDEVLSGTVEVAYANDQSLSSDFAIRGHGNIRNSDTFPSLYNWGDDTGSIYFPNRTWEALASDGVTKLTSTNQPYNCFDWLVPFYYSFTV